MASYMIYLVALLFISVQLCLGQSPMMFPGQPPLGGSPMGMGGMFSNPMFLPLAFSGLDMNKIMYMSMLANGGGGMGSMLPAFGLYNAFS